MPTYTVKRNPDYPEADSFYIMLDGSEIAGPMSYAECDKWFEMKEVSGD